MLEDIPLARLVDMYFQQDGAPPHYSRLVTEHLNLTFPGRWIGRGGPINWPARSPDLTPLDFYLWGHLKEKVYHDRPTTPENMKERIRNACRDIRPEILLLVH